MITLKLKKCEYHFQPEPVEISTVPLDDFFYFTILVFFINTSELSRVITEIQFNIIK